MARHRKAYFQWKLYYSVKPPLLLINFKLYNNSYGEGAISFSRILERISLERSVEIIISVPATMISRLADGISIPVFAQHVDASPLGAATGSITPELLKEAGAKGSILNHSERSMKLSELSDAINRMKESGLESVVCVDRYELVAPVGLLKPTALLIEPPELIGTGRAISREKPEVITRAVDANRQGGKVFLLAGAGIVTGEDVYRSIELGADGAAMASAVMKSADPAKAVDGLVDGILRIREKWK